MHQLHATTLSMPYHTLKNISKSGCHLPYHTIPYRVKEHGSLGALMVWVYELILWVFLIEISSCKALPEVPSTFTGPLHNIAILI